MRDPDPRDIDPGPRPRPGPRTRAARWLLAALAAVAGAGGAGAASWNPFMIEASTGAPLGPSVRTPQHIATLIQALEPYVPSLHHDPANDRYRLALFLFPVDGRGAAQLVPIARQRPVGEFRLARLLGCDGRTVWLRLDGIVGVSLASGKPVGPAELRAANRALAEPWDDPRRIWFDGRLRVSSPDRKATLEVDPDTLATQPVALPPRPADLPLEPALADVLASGVRVAPTQWLGLHTAQEAGRDLRVNGRLPRDARAEETRAARRFYRATLDPAREPGRATVLAAAPLEGGEFLNAAFARAGVRGEPLLLENPPSYLMIYTARPGLGGTTVVARVEPDTRLAWKTDTGIDRFKLVQILSDARTPAFIGTRPAVPGKVPEPILVVVDAVTGHATTTTLWK